MSQEGGSWSWTSSFQNYEKSMFVICGILFMEPGALSQLVREMGSLCESCGRVSVSEHRGAWLHPWGGWVTANDWELLGQSMTRCKCDWGWLGMSPEFCVTGYRLGVWTGRVWVALSMHVALCLSGRDCEFMREGDWMCVWLWLWVGVQGGAEWDWTGLDEGPWGDWLWAWRSVSRILWDRGGLWVSGTATDDGVSKHE